MKNKFFYLALLFLLLVCVSTPAQTTLPNLRMTSSNGVNTVFWSSSAYSDVLQVTTNLSSVAWADLAAADQVVLTSSPTLLSASNIVNIIGNEAAFSLPATTGQQFFRLSSPGFVFVSSFEVFYNGLLEFSQDPTMVMNGRVHANGPIYVGTTASLTFNAPVTTTSTISSPMANGLGPWTSNNWNTYFNGDPNFITNTTSLGIPPLSPTNYHFLIDLPPASEDSMSVTGQLRLFNQAEMILLVTNGIAGNTDPNVKLVLQSSVPRAYLPGNDPAKVTLNYSNASPALLKTNLPFLSLTNHFYDRREVKTNFVTQIDVGQLATWVITNSIVQSKLSSLGPTIFYVADQRNVSTQQLAVVRLSNGAQLPANNGLGFTVATMNPLYVMGDYNVQSSAGTATGTNNAYEVPAALLSDAITVLSSNWSDTHSYTAYTSVDSSYNALTTTINAAIVTGTVASTGNAATNFSGGFHNVPRLLQDWIGDTLYLNTSIIRLWDSNQATNQFRNPYGYSPPPVNPYYNPPTRVFNFDQNFLNPSKVPPGIPVLEVIL